MNDDDVLAQHLRRLADDSPRVAVDRGRVIALGRRRRLARAGGATSLGLVLAVGAYSGVAALAPDPAPAPPAAPSTAQTDPPDAAEVQEEALDDVREDTPRAVVDREAGTIDLPLDEVLWDERDWAVVQTAEQLYVAECMADQGLGEYYEFQGPFQVDGEELGFGVWRAEQVRETGYAAMQGWLPPDRAGAALTDEAEDAMVACYRAVLGAGLSYDLSAFEELAPQGYDPAAYTEQGAAVREEWRACLAEEGVQPPSEEGSMLPDGVLGAPFDEQVRVGLIDVACKDRLDVVQRMADAEAAEHIAYLARAEAYLAEVVPVQRQVLANAEALLAEHGVTVPQP